MHAYHTSLNAAVVWSGSSARTAECPDESAERPEGALRRKVCPPAGGRRAFERAGEEQTQTASPEQSESRVSLKGGWVLGENFSEHWMRKMRMRRMTWFKNKS